MRATYLVAGIAAVIAILFAAALAPLILSGALPFYPHDTSSDYKPGAILNRQVSIPAGVNTVTTIPGLFVSQGQIPVH